MSNLRKQRGLTQKLFLIECLPYKPDDLEKSFIIMGLSGNVYKVIMKSNSSCTCPDFLTRGNICKHLYFVFLKIMKLSDKVIDDKISFTANELNLMFKNQPEIIDLTNDVIADKSFKKYYDEKKDKILSQSSYSEKTTDDICPICLDDLTNGDELECCKYSCGKFIHKDCLNMYHKISKTCIFCKKEWNKEITNYTNLINKTTNSFTI